ncbi:protein kinase domain-containing protein [Actinoplanes sp. URMC 104]|uniref:serine/threonine-protein kinase n=1 Tax=Actinoplanes sp. URMC 104 TaxID=3423409 RepID=UPI003F19D93F
MDVRQALGGRYQLLDELGAGGMAVVWRAHDEVLARPVAVKVLAGRFAGDPQSRARIRDEARAAATLSHPNIAQVYDYGESDDLPYVVMELVNGPTLQQKASSGPLPPRTIFRICGEVAAALAAAHEDGLVHRDIKMANIMLSPGGVKVVDFGIAAAAGPGEPEDMLVGTPAYLAPERLTGDAVEPASDVYALGVLLYRLLAHEPPWSVESTTQMLQAHVYVAPAPLPQLPGVPAAVAQLIDRCLLKNPADRPTAAEVSATLADAAEAAAADAVREGDETAAMRVPHHAIAPPAPVTPDATPRVRRKHVLAAAGITVVVAAALGAWIADGEPQAGGRQQVAEAPTSAAPSAVISGRVVPPATTAGGNDPAPATAGAPGPGGVIAGSGSPLPLPSAVPSGSPLVSPSVSALPQPSTSSEPSPSPTADPPEGRRLSSRGGVVYAVCAGGEAELTGWEPAEGYTVQVLQQGPALAARILFSDRIRYRMTVTCVGDTPTSVVLPL